jgi:hypothetical protein
MLYERRCARILRTPGVQGPTLLSSIAKQPMNASIISNDVEVEPLAPPRCDNCTVRAAVVVVRIKGTPVVREVCHTCLIDNDGRTGWPLYADIVRGFAGEYTS